MAESLMYAELQVTKPSPGRSTSPWVQATAPHQADGTYDNFQQGPVGEGPARNRAQQRRERRWRGRVLPLILLAACLVLLITTITLGVCYWQQGQRLQQTSRAHIVERDGLWQQVDVREQRLRQVGAVLGKTQEELAQTRVELGQAQQEGNRSQEDLHRRDVELQDTRVQLKETKAALEQEQEHSWDLQQQLDEAAITQARAWTCQVTDCCPEAWVLHHGKCLYVTKEKKTWLESKLECEEQFSQLLVSWEWERTTMPSFLTNTDTLFWIGLRQDQGQWTWIDGTSSKEPRTFGWRQDCGAMKGGNIEATYCSSFYAKHLAVCEKPAEPDMPRRLFPFGPWGMKMGPFN
ncbi:B-cell differentiation antigen CD72 [Alligator mississippiensis]|uniref:CD72 molecule n=1 Tax=Alligator mississippiensis TaxID=8496 RepID=A0A151M7N3_ALLMI|nr:B-cell differentiation antigen CD72 [Alligator mississippiensis]KYO20524.1 CD72 molecule [Alligator mississippiensis]